MKTILFRFDFGSKIGYGHLKRCSVLAKKFKQKGYRCILLGDIEGNIKKEDKFLFYKVINLNRINLFNKTDEIIKVYNRFDCDYLILDLIKFDIQNQAKLKKSGIKWLQFIGNINIKCIANQFICSIPFSNKDLKKIKVNKDQKTFIGKNYSIIRQQFLKNKKKHSVKKIFVCMGGGDDRGSIIFVLKSIIVNIKDYKINLLIGESPHYKKIKEWIKKNNLKKIIKILRNKEYIVEYIDESKFAICSGGTITHEIDARGKKMMIISIIKNQEFQAKKWVNFDNYYLGSFSKDKIKIKYKLNNFLDIMKKIKNIKFKKRENKFLDKIIYNAITN